MIVKFHFKDFSCIVYLSNEIAINNFIKKANVEKCQNINDFFLTIDILKWNCCKKKIMLIKRIRNYHCNKKCSNNSLMIAVNYSNSCQGCV